MSRDPRVVSVQNPLFSNVFYMIDEKFILMKTRETYAGGHQLLEKASQSHVHATYFPGAHSLKELPKSSFGDENFSVVVIQHKTG